MYTAEEDVLNSITHFLSALTTVLFTFLIIFNSKISLPHMLPIYIMGLTATWTFFSSYLYHSTRIQPKRERNRIVDQASIYIMIMGNGIGIALLSSSSIISVVCCVLLLLISALLIVNLCLNQNMSETFLVTSYLLLEWLAVIPSAGLFLPSNFTQMPQFLFLLVGGIVYSIGIIFYIQNKKWYHTIWHIFVMVGFGLHFMGSYLCLQIY